MVNSIALFGLIASAFALVACTNAVTVDVARKGETVSVDAIRAGTDTPPCVQGLIVTLADTDIATTPSLWEISTAEPGRCRTSFTYGQVPPGYTQSGPAPRLLPGSRYLVEITGPGLQGGRAFTFPTVDGPAPDTAK
jgi:hypothetical protein